ncbi:TIGR02757 family protein [Lutibacter flavus]|uniref:TIGR02757 family protein n=1 Tax=Lutibacter flavus TaxID=691689 RepID=A0A238VJX9_9FLAO|nr:TIGR02757 family protein [Lutibacter flavus]SNR34003.1 TIGR02757 family protein [Lutibacter flavus]
MDSIELKEFLDEKVLEYNQPKFIESDPIQIPHRYNLKEDIEISAFLTSTIAWGNRKMIIKNANKMMEFMGNSPYDFVMNHDEHHLDSLDGFVHRTFNSIDLKYFIKALKHIYINHNGLESLINHYASNDSLQPAIHELKKVFFELPHPLRTTKHMSDPMKGSSSKRLNMWLRWMIRNDTAGVDFGIWKNLSPSQLSCPLDVHSGNVARKLGLLTRKQNDSKALAELDASLRAMDRNAPVKYDFALFGLGIFENF